MMRHFVVASLFVGCLPGGDMHDKISTTCFAMTLATAGTIISWLAFVFLIISGFELSIRFADKMKSMKEVGVIEYTAFRSYFYPVGFSSCLLLAMLVLFSKPFSSGWTVLVVTSFILILYTIGRRLIKMRNK